MVFLHIYRFCNYTTIVVLHMSMIPNVIYYIICIPSCVVVNLEQEKLRTLRKSSSILPTLLPAVPSKRSRQVTDDVDAFFSSHSLDRCLQAC